MEQEVVRVKIRQGAGPKVYLARRENGMHRQGRLVH